MLGPKEPCRIRYRRRAAPTVTMAMGAALSDLAAAARASEEGAAAGGCPVAHGAGDAARGVQRADDGDGKTATDAGEATPDNTGERWVELDRDLCQGHAVCTGEAPHLFELDPEDGRVRHKVEALTPDDHAAAQPAARYCPIGSISLRRR